MLDVKIRRQSTDRFVQAFRSLREADALAVLADLNAFFTSERLPYYAVAERQKRSASDQAAVRRSKRGGREGEYERFDVRLGYARDILTAADGIRKPSNRYIAAN